jgi:glycerophosphoryl diester phosphodiesterase
MRKHILLRRTLLAIPLTLSLQLLTIAPAAGKAGTTSAPGGGSDFYVIAHMINGGPRYVDWAVGQGANALEMDLRFDAAGTPTVFFHGTPCDCTCRGLARAGNICGVVAGVSSLNHACSDSTDTIGHLQQIATHKDALALVIVDSKVDAKPETNLTVAGKKVIELLDTSLFGNGFAGNVIVGVPKIRYSAYLEAAVRQAETSPNKARYFFVIDGENKRVNDTIKQLVMLATKNRVYANGNSSCSPITYYSEIGVGIQNQKSGSVGMVYTWTIDKASSMDKYIASGVSGIITNEPGLLRARALAAGKTLAVPTSTIPPAFSDEVVSGP